MSATEYHDDGFERPALPPGLDTSTFWDDLEWALGQHELTRALAHDLASLLNGAPHYIQRTQLVPPERQAELAANVARAVANLERALAKYDELVVGVLGPPSGERATLERLLRELRQAAEALPEQLEEVGVLLRTPSRATGRPPDKPILVMATGTLITLEQHGVATVYSDTGVTARVLRLMLGAVDQLRGEPVRERAYLKDEILRWMTMTPEVEWKWMQGGERGQES